MTLTKAVDNLCLYDPDFKHIADGFIAEFGANAAVHEVNNLEDLRTAVNSYRAVKFLEIVIHGSPGTLHTKKERLSGWYIAVLAESNPNFLQKGAKILFDSCNIGKGKSGDQFMDDLGIRILKGKGGTIGASTVNSWTSPLFGTGFFMQPLSFGRLKVKSYNLEGKPAGALQVDRLGVVR